MSEHWITFERLASSKASTVGFFENLLQQRKKFHVPSRQLLVPQNQIEFPDGTHMIYGVDFAQC